MATTQAPVQTVQVTCINKADRTSACEGITHLGGHGWWATRQQVIDSIEARTHAFYTNVGGKISSIGVRTSANGVRYVQTHADAHWNNNLLALPECR